MGKEQALGYRKTRIVCVSDTHTYSPQEAGFKLPKGDVLIHAGDLTKTGGITELRKTIGWIRDADFEVKIIISGNHDVTLDPPFYAEHGSHFHKHLEIPHDCIDVVVKTSPSIIFLNNSSSTIRLKKPNGPRTMFNVFGSPYSRASGIWAFGYEETEAKRLWDKVPLHTDVVVTHMPPHLHCDSKGGISLGCEELRQALRKVRPMLAVCGHIHEGRGYEIVRWRNLLSSPGDDCEEETIVGILPPMGSKKQSIVDLTGRRGALLDNISLSRRGALGLQTELAASFPAAEAQSMISPTQNRTVNFPQHGGQYIEMTDGVETRRNFPARNETCIVNAAIVATSWPHKGGKKFHTPIVVDIELPVWDECNM